MKITNVINNAYVRIANNKIANNINFKGNNTQDTFERTEQPSCFKSDQDRINLSKKISCLLRHTPQFYNLEIDKNGWTSMDVLIDEFNKRHNEEKQITRRHLQEMADKCDKKRYEIKDGKIRALYGHSIPLHIEKVPAEPPKKLYHGTSERFLKAIEKQGLLPKKRQYVHLAHDIDTAMINGKRKDENPVILVIDAEAADKNGNKFYIGNDSIWLADSVPPEYISVLQSMPLGE